MWKGQMKHSRSESSRNKQESECSRLSRSHLVQSIPQYGLHFSSSNLWPGTELEI